VTNNSRGVCILVPDTSQAGTHTTFRFFSAGHLLQGTENDTLKYHFLWHIYCLQMLAVYRVLRSFLPHLKDHHVLIRIDNMSVVTYITCQGGLRSHFFASDPPLVSREIVVPQRNVYPQRPEFRSRHPVKARAEAWGMETPPQDGGVVMGEIRPSGRGSNHISRDNPLSSVVLLLHCSALGGSIEGSLVKGQSALIALYWPTRVWFSDIISLLAGRELPLRRDRLSQVRGTIYHP